MNVARANVREVSVFLEPKGLGIVAVARPLLLLFFPRLQERGILAGNRTCVLLNTSEASGRGTGESLETGLSLLPTTQAESSVNWESSWPPE